MRYYMTMFPLGNPKNGELLREIQSLGISEVSWDFEFIFDCNEDLKPRLIEIANKYMRSLGWREKDNEFRTRI